MHGLLIIWFGQTFAARGKINGIIAGMDYELITTLGPSSQDETMWAALLENGATCFRLNTSHLSLKQLNGWLERLEDFFLQRQLHIPLVLDLQGSKWRLGDLLPRDLTVGERITFRSGKTAERSGELPVPHADFFAAAALSGAEIVLNDAKCRLRVEAYGSDWLKALVTLGGPISAHKGITYSQSDFRTEALSEKDQWILESTRSMTNMRYAISYLRDAEEMQKYRQQIGPEAYLIAKLERRDSLNIPIMALAADELWLCRGDLGAELGFSAMAEAVEQFSGQVAQSPVPVILAGQVLEHLTEHSTPTRSEICYLYHALSIGYRGIVLSDETAVGKNPITSCAAGAMFRRSGL